MEILFLISCLIGSFIQTVSGFGFGIFVLSVFPYFLPSTNAGVAISNLLSMSLSAFVAFRMRKRLDVRMMLPSMFTFFAVSTAAIFIFADKPDGMIKKMLAVALILMSIYFMFFSSRIKMCGNIRNGVISGALGGILGGLFGMGGPPIVVYLLGACEDDSEKYMANIQFYFAVTNCYSTIVRAFAGIINGFVIKFWLMGLGAVLVGMLIGRRVFKKISAQNLRKLVYGFMAVSGVVMLLQ